MYNEVILTLIEPKNKKVFQVANLSALLGFIVLGIAVGTLHVGTVRTILVVLSVVMITAPFWLKFFFDAHRKIGIVRFTDQDLTIKFTGQEAIMVLLTDLLSIRFKVDDFEGETKVRDFASSAGLLQHREGADNFIAFVATENAYTLQFKLSNELEKRKANFFLKHYQQTLLAQLNHNETEPSDQVFIAPTETHNQVEPNPTHILSETTSKTNGIAFGWNTSWFAIRHADFNALWETLSKDFNLQETTDLQTAIAYGINNGYALLPPIKGWVILLTATDDRFLKRAKNMDVEAIQFFHSERSTNYLHLVSSVNGELLRELIISDQEILNSSGEPTSIEVKQGEMERLALLEGETDPEMIENIHTQPFEVYFREENMFNIAEVWSINPTNLDKLQMPNIGFILTPKFTLVE